jgi:hypothetical protein
MQGNPKLFGQLKDAEKEALIYSIKSQRQLQSAEELRKYGLEAQGVIKPKSNPERKLVSLYDVINTAGHLLGFCRAKATLTATPKKDKGYSGLLIEVAGHWFRDYIKTLIAWGVERLPGRPEEVILAANTKAL